MDEKRLQEIEARLQSVRGEWYVAANDPCRGELYERGSGPNGSDQCIGWSIDLLAADIAANAPTDLADLLAEVRRLQRECDRRDIMAAWSEDILSDEDAFRLMGLEQTGEPAFNDLYGYWSDMRDRAYELDEKAQEGSSG